MEFSITKAEDIPARLGAVHASVLKGLERGEVVITLGRKKRNTLTNKKLHAVIGDIYAQGVIELEGAKIPLSCYEFDVAKAFLVRWFDVEMKEQGESLRKCGRNVVCPMTGVAMYVRPSTTEFSQKEAGMFIEWLYSMGSTELGVEFKPPALAVYAEYRELNS